MSHRFHCPNLNKGLATLVGSEAHHALHVLRLKTGDAVRLFDGCGNTADGTVASASRREVTVTVAEVSHHARTANAKLTVASAVPKGDRLKFLVEKLTEIGVTRFIPVQTARSVVDPRQTKLNKLRATVVAAAKQSEQNWLMRIDQLESLTTVLADARAAARRICIAHPGGTPTRSETTARNTNSEAFEETLLLIGPEGGFTDAEVTAALSAGAEPLHWPDSILRIETAAVVFAAMLLAQ